MLTIEGGRFAALRDLDATLSRMRSLRPADWERQTPCVGWQVRHLAAHLAETTRRFASTFLPLVKSRTFPAPTAEEPSQERPDDPPDAIVARATLGRNQFASITALLSPEDAETQLGEPAPDRPPRTAARMMTVAALEFGVHRSDLEAALGISPGLTEEAIAAADAILGAGLARIATASGEAPETPLRYELLGDRIDRTLTWTGDAWTTDTALDVPTTRITADDAALALFLCGRIPATSDTLTITGDRAAAARFKTYVPGP